MSVRMGAHQIFWTCIVLLEFAYAGAVVVGVLSPVSHRAGRPCSGSMALIAALHLW